MTTSKHYVGFLDIRIRNYLDGSGSFNQQHKNFRKIHFWLHIDIQSKKSWIRDRTSGTDPGPYKNVTDPNTACQKLDTPFSLTGTASGKKITRQPASCTSITWFPIFMGRLFNNVVDPDQKDPYVFGPSGSVIICTDPDLDSDPSINKQKSFKKPRFLVSIFCDFFLTFIFENWCKWTFKI